MTRSEPKDKVIILVYDDYNRRVRADSDTIGTITPNIGVSAFTNSYKLIEITFPDDRKII